MSMSASSLNIIDLVKKKVASDEKCQLCIEGSSEGKTPKYVCLIERQDSHALFIFTSRDGPCQTAEDLQLEHVFPVNEQLSIQTEACLFCLQVTDKKFLIEVSPESETFILEVQKVKELLSQDNGLPQLSVFSWLHKYQQQACQSAPVSITQVDGNPLENDAVDHVRCIPLDKADNVNMPLDNFDNANIHLDSFENANIPLDSVDNANIPLDNFENANTPLDRADSANMQLPNTNGFGNDLGSIVHQSGNGAMKKFCSQESLDNVLEFENSNNLSKFMDKVIEKELGLKPGTDVAAGIKPLTAREKIANYIIKSREKEYINIKTFRIFVGTWNVNGQGTINLSEWLACDKDPPDIYVIGFQELDISNQAYIFSDSARESEWQAVVQKYLHPKARYQKVKSFRLIGVLLIVYIMEIHIDHVSMTDIDYVPTGIMGMLGNKGGVGIRLNLHNSTLCFITSHLAAHQEEFERRNQDTCDIESKIRFKKFLPPLTVKDHDMVFWLGDLNYRIDLDIGIVKDYVNLGRLDLLIAKDQLYKQMKTHKVYKTYTESEIKFPPTYKYTPGTDNFDSSEKCRIPAWCDRILYKGEGIKPIVYRSHPALKISDHKPVSSLFDAGIKVVEKERYKKTYEDIMKQLDKLENDYLPQVSLTNKEFVFKDVKFSEPQEKILAIANIGQIPVTFEFINKLDDNFYCKPWLKVTPCTAVIAPGDSCEIFLEVLVDKTIAYQFNCGLAHIEDILVLHLHGGKDIFIPISGNYIVSSFGSSIEALVQMLSPIREIPADRLVELERPGSLSKVDILSEGTRLFACPKEIFRLVNHIWEYGRHQEDLFQQPGLNIDIHQIRDCLDTTWTSQMLPGSIHSIAEALILFLEALAEPVIPYSMYEDCLNCTNSYLLCSQVVSKMPECHKNVFEYLCAFLQELLRESKLNNLNLKYISKMFGDVLLRAPPSRLSNTNLSNKSSSQQTKSEDIKRSGFLYQFLAHA